MGLRRVTEDKVICDCERCGDLGYCFLFSRGWDVNYYCGDCAKVIDKEMREFSGESLEGPMLEGGLSD